MRIVVCGLLHVLGLMFLVVFSWFDKGSAQIFGAALAIAGTLIGIGLFLDHAQRQVTSRKTN